MSTAILRFHYKVAALHMVKIPWKIVYAVSFLFFLAMVVWYIAMVNQLTKGAYLIKNYNKDIRELTTENKMLEASFAQSSFLGDVGIKAKQLSFEKTTNVKYIPLLQNSLAAKK